MLLSMTGFSSLTTQVPHKYGKPLNITITIKSLNARFFEASCRLPHIFNQLELPCTKILKNKLIRGSVYCTINVSNIQNLTIAITPSVGLIEGYLNALKNIQKNFSIGGTVEIDDLLMLPDIFERTETPVDETTAQAILSLIDNVCDDLIRTRSSEGAALETDLRKRLAIIHTLMQNIEPRAQQIAEARKNKIMSTMNNLASTSSETAEQSLPFIYTQIEKFDVHEEITRLNAHLVAFEETMTSSAIEKGKKLDFITQELMREITTLTAKAGDAHLGGLGISLKVELEKIREQVQNIL